MAFFASRTWLGLEFGLIFVALPWLYLKFGYREMMLPALWLAAATLGLALWRNKSFERATLRSFSPGKAEISKVLGLFLALGLLLTLLVWFFMPDNLFGLPRRHPRLWVLILLLYPLLSVYPQELIYRAFLFQRYRKLFQRNEMLCLMSAVAFGWMHIVFGHWQAVALSFFGGWLFARTYQRTASLPWVSLEHSLYGGLVFTVGVGIYFIGASSALAKFFQNLIQH